MHNCVCGDERGNMLKSRVFWMSVSAIGVLLSVMTCAADVWYVSAANYGKAGMTGESETLAFGTIQEAVDAASANDIVYVLPGVYCQGDRIAWDGQKTRDRKSVV